MNCYRMSCQSLIHNTSHQIQYATWLSSNDITKNVRSLVLKCSKILSNPWIKRSATFFSFLRQPILLASHFKKLLELLSFRSCILVLHSKVPFHRWASHVSVLMATKKIFLNFLRWGKVARDISRHCAMKLDIYDNIM